MELLDSRSESRRGSAGTAGIDPERSTVVAVVAAVAVVGLDPPVAAGSAVVVVVVVVGPVEVVEPVEAGNFALLGGHTVAGKLYGSLE